MSFDFGEVLTRGWQIAWKNKVLWIYAALPLFFMIVYMPLFFIFIPLMMPGSDMAEPMVRFIENPAFGVVFMTVAIITTALSLTAQLFGNTAMSLGAVRADEGVEKQGFRELFKSSLPSNVPLLISTLP